MRAIANLILRAVEVRFLYLNMLSLMLYLLCEGLYECHFTLPISVVLNKAAKKAEQ